MLNWGENIGLLEASLEVTSTNLGLNHNVISDVLLEIQAAFRGCVDVQKKYGPFIEQSTMLSPSQPNRQRVSTRRVLLERVLAIYDKPARAATCLQWAMIKKDSFSKLVNKLIAFNDRMESFLDRNALEEMHSMQIQSNMMLLQVTDEVTQLRLLVEALNITRQLTEHGTYVVSSVLRPTSRGRRPENTVASLAQFKAEASLVERDVLQQDPIRIDLPDIMLEIPDHESARSVGRYQQHDIWLEWREQVEDERPSPVIQRIIGQRVKQLAALLCTKDKPPLFRAPFCLGYTCDDRDEVPRYALVYKVEVLPRSKYLGLQTLRDALQILCMPSLGKRIALASVIAESLFYLHAVSWLHKGLRSDNIVFIRQQSLNTSGDHEDVANISSPILSGFDYSRPDLIDEQTFRNGMTVEHELYRHPDLLQLRTKRSRKSHDIYSLGLILIEIALWRPIEEIVGVQIRRSRLLEVGQKLAQLDERGNALRAELAAQVGDEYAEVVSRCVVGGKSIGASPGTEETDPDVAAPMQESFFENVVQKLQRLRV